MELCERPTWDLLAAAYTPVTPERSAWLRQYFADDHRALQAHLSARYPGSHVVAMPGAHVGWHELRQEAAFVAPDAVVAVRGATGACHDNVAALAAAGRLDAAYCGYALSGDGLWRFHSWGERDGRLVETTEKRVMYWGRRQPSQGMVKRGGVSSGLKRAGVPSGLKAPGPDRSSW